MFPLTNLEEYFSYFKKEYVSDTDEYSILPQKLIDHNFNDYGLGVRSDGSLCTKYRPDQLIIDSSITASTFHPSTIRPNDWWSAVTKYFPLHSICGAKTTSIDEVKASSDRDLMNNGYYYLIHQVWLMKEYNCKPKILEIGPGYGQVLDYIKRFYYDLYKNYYALDVVKLFDYNKLYVGDGYTFPKELEDGFNLIISWNCFQHLSMEQRQSYIKEAYRVASKNCLLYISCFVDTKPKYNDDGVLIRRYCYFFGQQIELPTVEELANIINLSGFSVISPIVNDATIKNDVGDSFFYAVKK